MDDLKRQLKKTLVANIIKAKCADNDNLIFSDSWCTQDRVIRFTTPFFKNLFSSESSEKGAWQNGFFVMYEISLNEDDCFIDCNLSKKDLPYKVMDVADKLASVTGDVIVDRGMWRLGQWSLPDYYEETDALDKTIDQFVGHELGDFENTIKKALSDNPEAKVNLKEGPQYEFVSRRYERNPEARRKCLEAHGTVCAVCGIDFGKVYGPELEGKIEVHHIVPISSIGKEYVVDPVKDLIPVCPNCHTALHSKKGGVYTVEELRKMIK